MSNESDTNSEDLRRTLQNNEDDEVRRARNRRPSFGKIPVPPVPMTIEDIKEAAAQERETHSTIAPRKAVDPRKSSVSLEVFRNFKESNERKHLPTTQQMVHVEFNGRFREMKKGVFQNEQRQGKKKEKEMEQSPRNFIVPPQYRDIISAYQAQKAINQFVIIVQGFLAGVSVTLAMFAFNFELLSKGYKWMCIPIHSIFMVAFTLGLTTAIDRLGIYKLQHLSSVTSLKESLTSNSFIGVIIWSIGLLTTLLCIKVDASLYYNETSHMETSELYLWRIYSVTRAFCASVGWLFLAFRTDSDIVSKQLKIAVTDALNQDTSNRIGDKKDVVLNYFDM